VSPKSIEALLAWEVFAADFRAARAGTQRDRWRLMPVTYRSLVAATLVVLSPAVVACNALTGADDLVFTETNADGQPSRGQSDGSNLAPGQILANMAPATGVRVREITIYQGVKRTLMADGQRQGSDIPLVKGRNALVRVFFDVDASYNEGPVTARLEIDGQTPIDVFTKLRGGSDDSDIESTLNFDVPGATLVPGASYRVTLLQPKEQVQGDNPGAVFPTSGFEPLDVDPTDSVVRVELIPIVYQADGSNREPDTSPGQLKQYQDRFYSMYPVSRVDLTVHPAVNYANQLLADGTGWSDLLNSLAAFRNDENADDNVYYYGIFSPTAKFEEFCKAGCVAGLGFVSGPADVNSRVAIGLGFGGTISSDTAVHEIGHAHGRSHAPCGGVDGADPSFPYAGGAIGTWGYDLLSGQLFSPVKTTDVMGYCSPIWLSDYTYKALFTRAQFVSGASVVVPPEMMNRRYERVAIDGRGNARFLPAITLRKPPLAETRTVTIETTSGSESLAGQFYKYDHLDGGLLFVPQPARSFRSLRIEIDGRMISAVK
jgi:Peptidase M66